MGGPNSDQLIEYVHSFDPRSWSCLHIAEGGLLCDNVIVQNNDIGPCGSDVYQQWADGISVSCRSAVVRNNLVNDPTDGGIVLFGSPGSLVENNTIWVTNVSHNYCMAKPVHRELTVALEHITRWHKHGRRGTVGW